MTTEPTVDDLIQRGIYDPGAENAAERLELVRNALRLGATLDELAVEGPESLMMKLQLRGGKERLTLAQAAERAGIDLELARRLGRASGLPDQEPDALAYTEEDVEIFQVFEAGRQVFGDELTLQLSRVLGASMARVADAAISVFSVNLGSQARATGIDSAAIMSANETAIGLLPSVVKVMDLLLRRHIEARSRDEMIIPEEEGVDTVHRAVGFCDLVGYTEMSGHLTTKGLGTLLTEFETHTADLITEHGGHVVKLIGDEVMFVAPDATTICHIATMIAAVFAGRGDLPPVRIGLNAGLVVTREGDYYGPVVNLAARLVKVAPSGGVVAPAGFRELAGDGYIFDDAGVHELKGIEELVATVLVRPRS